jgi:hypothetical protein
MERNITITVNDKYLFNLKRQKRLILQLVETGLMPLVFEEEHEGILGMMDEIQEKAVEQGFDENEVFDFPDNHPKGEKGHAKDFDSETTKLKTEIILSAHK